MKKEFSKIIKIEKKGKGKVYDFTVDGVHRILANNFYTSNCSIKHPDSESFIDAKLEQGKVTGANISVKVTDEFMKAAQNAQMFTQCFPTDSENPIHCKSIEAQKLWKKIIHNAWKSAEPGVLFWDTIMKESVPDCYQDHGFTTVSTNPCVIGDSLIAVADGRNAVSIKQLAEEGIDVPVYSLDNNGNIVIRKMRNPRITGYNQQIYKVTIEGGYSFKVTGNHKIRLTDGSYVETKDLKYGDSLHVMTKSVAAFNDVIKNSNSKSQDYYWLSNSGKKGLIPEHRIISNCNENNMVVHHKDFDGLNNKYDNLEIMSREEHNKLHTQNMIGEKNPYHRMNKEWRYNFASHKGEKNHKYNFNITNNDIRENALILTKKIGRRFSNNDWISYAKENNLPQYFSDFRFKELGSVLALSKWAAVEIGLEMINIDPRVVKTYKSALMNGYDSEIVNNEVLVTKVCEECGEEFKINYFRREISFCSHSCSLIHINKNKEISEKRKESINQTYSKKGNLNKENQLKIYSDLKFEISREPLLKEWENKCKLNGISYRLNTKYGFKNFEEIKENAEYYNHKVISVELDGFEDVYNGTVDEFHNFFSGYFEEINKFNKPKFVSINQLQCGEITLCPYDSCRLLAINLYGFVEKPFTKDAWFNMDKFKKYVIYAERFMDDIIDLEIEKINKIMEKIEIDPENEETKRVERDTWIKIMDMTIKGRRTGLGVTAEGDMLAALGLRYGTPEATDFSTEIHKNLAISAYKSSAIMAKERGAFPVYDYERELNNPFVQRLKDSDPELDKMLKEYGRRNIALLTIAPTGCLSEKSVIKTDRGEISLGDIFLINDIDINNLKGLNNIWIEPKEDINVFNINGEKNKITKLYWNGFDETKIIKYSNNDEIESTLEHKFLVKINNNEAVWKKTNELKIGDKIIKLKNGKI